MRPPRLILLIPALLLAAMLTARAPAASAAPASCMAATPGAVAGFFDANLPGRLAEYHVPGAAVSVVAGGQRVFAKGYGLADAQRRVAFDPDSSLVRIASITKLFTWTAVMQQVQAGRLDLDADVNTYLRSFKVPATYKQPVTLRALMNHTAGFEDRFVGTGAASAADVRPLGAFLATNMPARIRPPGVVSAYSNYGAGLAGYIVQQVSGEPYEQYVRRHILDPLGMTHSTAIEPLPAALAPDLARSYESEVTPPKPVPFMFDRMAPDGSVSASATDMARFMLAHLDGGRGILDPGAEALMHEPSFKADPRLGGWAHGFMDRNMSGHRILMHDGSWEGFLSVLVMVPDCGLGLFITTNGTGGVDAISPLLPEFLARFAPAPAGVPAATAPGAATGAPRPGFYEPARHNESTVEKLTTLVAPARLTVNPDGTLHFRGGDWKPAGGGLYTRLDREDHLVAFSGGGLDYVATDGPTLQRMRPTETLPVNLAVLLVFAVGLLSLVPLLVVVAWRRLRHSPPRTSRRWRAARALAALAAVLGAGFLAYLAEVLFGGSANFVYGVPLSFKLLLILPVAAVLAGVAALALTAAGWRGAGARVTGRIHQLTLLLGLGALTWFLVQWNLLGWQLS